jgi:hypothetical protein
VFHGEREIGRTEFVKDCPDPNFKTTIDVMYTPGKDQRLSFRIYDLDYLGKNGEVLPTLYYCEESSTVQTLIY